MLILSRGKNESIEIADNIHIRVLEVRGNSVRLGIEAPIKIRVHRNECHALEGARDSNDRIPPQLSAPTVDHSPADSARPE